MRLRPLLIGAAVCGVALAGCSQGASSQSNESGANSVASSSDSLTVAKPDGAITTESNNIFVSDASSNRLGYSNALFEPLGVVNLVDPTQETVPWLAEEITWSDDYKSVQLKARSGVKWNDGQDFTAEDIAFNIQLLIDNPELDGSAMPLESVEVDGDTVTVNFTSGMYARQDHILHRQMLPKHIWEDVEDYATFENLEPVGTGPYVLSNFTTQSVELTARDDYWNGKVAVPTLYFVSYNDNTALTTALTNGEADWAQSFIANVQSAYLDKDPEHNVYWAAPALAIDALFVNTEEGAFSDLAMRQAANMVIDRENHKEIAREGSVSAITSITGLPTPVGESFIAPQYEGKEYEVDVDGARALLEENGYTWEGEQLIDPEGKAVSLKLSVPQGWSDYVTGLSLISDQLKLLGAEVQLDTPDSDTWWDARAKGEYDAVLNWTESGATPYSMYSSMMDERWYAPLGENADYNFGRYKNDKATAALNDYINATDETARQAAMDTVEEIFVEDIPAIAIGNRPFFGAYNTRSYVGWPSEDDPYAPADPTNVASILIYNSLEPASE